MIVVPSGIDLHSFPSSDDDFRRFAEDQLARLEQPDPDGLQLAIRVRYPLAVVRVRSDLARHAGPDVVWYAFRRALIESPPDRWWEQATAWAVVDAQRGFVDASAAFAATVEVARASLLGMRIEDLANPADPTATDDVAALWIELRKQGEVHGTLRFNRLDGSRRELEYHASADGAGPGRYRVVVRER